MTTQTLTYCTTKKLDCCPITEVVICVPTVVVTSGLGFLNATMTDFAQTGVSCGNQYYTYTFEYDDSQLVTPETPLISSEVSGVICKGCFTSWIETFAGDGCPLEVEDTETVDLTIDVASCQTLSADVNLGTSVESGDNKIVLVGDGLYVCPLGATDTESVTLTIAEDTNECQSISADVNISADEDNCTEIRADGLYTPCGSSSFITSVLDTTCIDLTVTDGVLSAVPIIDDAADNCLECLPPGEGSGGLYVACPIAENAWDFLFGMTNKSGNINTGEDTLYTNTIPANILSNGISGHQVRLKIFGTFAANANAKTIKVYFNTLIFTTGAVAFNGGAWEINVEILAVTALVQRVSITFITGAAAMPTLVTVLDTAVDTTAVSTITVTGTATATDDILGYGFVADWYRH